MLTVLGRCLSLVVAAVLVVAAPMIVVAQGDDPPPVGECPPGYVYEPGEGCILIEIVIPGDPDPGDPGDPDPGDPGEPGEPVDPGERRCVSPTTGEVIPCERAGGWNWVSGWECYARQMEPQPPKSDPVWDGNEDGAIYDCVMPRGDEDLNPGESTPQWSATPPWEEEAPDPGVLAQRAVEAMQLSPIEIGMVPEPREGYIGVVGMPAWMWVEDPESNTWGPIIRTASAGGYSVTATGQVDRIEWDMGEGTVITCTTEGTPYADAYGKMDSPDCGHTYLEQGTYEVTATAYWSVRWSGMGQSGVIELDLSETATVSIGEIQVLVTN